MPTDDDILIDAPKLRLLALVEAGDRLETLLHRYDDRVFLSPAAAALLTGRSPKALRAACDDGSLPDAGKGVHRMIPLGALGYDAGSLGAALNRIANGATPSRYRRDLPKALSADRQAMVEMLDHVMGAEP